MGIIGIDIGGTKCAVVKADDGGRIEEVRQFATVDVDATLAEIYRLIADLKPGDAPVFGISCGGPLDSDRGLILSPPNLAGWDEVPICRILTDRFGGEAYLMNDANAGALAEWAFGAARGARNVVFLTHGTGMGAGLILDNRLYEGTNGMAGEVGHIRMAADGPVGYGKAGSFEGFTSGGGIAQLAQARARAMGGRAGFVKGRIEDVTAKDVAEAAAAGDEAAREILGESGRYLGMGLAILVDILNPEVIILGSIYARAGRFLEPSIREALSREALPQSLAVCRIVRTALGEEIGNHAAVAVALYRKGRLGK